MYKNLDEQWNEDPDLIAGGKHSVQICARLDSDCFSQEDGAGGHSGTTPLAVALAVKPEIGQSLSRSAPKRKPHLSNASTFDYSTPAPAALPDLNLTEDQARQLEEVLNQIDSLKLHDECQTKMGFAEYRVIPSL